MAAALAGPQATCPSLLWAAQSLGSCLSGPCSSPLSPLNSQNLFPNHLERLMDLQY